MHKSFLLSIFLFCSFFITPSLAAVKHDLTFKVARGDAFYKFFFSTGLSGNLLTKLMISDERAQKLNNIYPGDKFRIILNDDHGLEQIIFSPANDNPLFIFYDGQSFSYENTSSHSISELSHTIITIKKSLNYDAKKAGVAAEIIKIMVDNFSWDIDFSKDLRKGDKFTLSWGKDQMPRAIIYEGSRKTIALFKYKNTSSQVRYFTSKGATLNDSFDFAPVKYSRISSSFNKSRYHPTLKIYRSHRGTDFAAPTGTPVYAPAKGLVKYRATLSGYGNVIYLKHGPEIITVYAHLQKFAKGLKSGEKVKKGDLIGYVGTTGQSTGPHLHYEIRVGGVHKDAEKIKLPKKLFVPSSAMPNFQKNARKILQDLDIG
jgi:murein DD-endopeptidase MepM/ murein hydrolase activator NlpD